MNNQKKKKSTSSNSETEELKKRIFINKDYPKGTRQFTRDGFDDELENEEEE